LADGGGAVAAPTAADKFVFISPSFYLEASGLKKEEGNDLTWFIYLP